MQLDPKSGGDPQADADVYEMLWDCEYCGTRKLLGLTHRFCPNCGAGQNPAKRYFPPDDEKVAVKDHPYHGADRVCPSCRNPNSAKAQFCGQCGMSLEQAAKAKTQADQIRTAGTQEFASATQNPAKAVQKQASAARHWGIVAALLALFALIGAALLWTMTVPVTLDHRGWERTINVEAFLPRQQGIWCESMPADAYAVRQHQAVRSMRQVPDGQICDTRRVDRGDGTYQEKQECRPKYRNEMVYSAFCDFTVNRWGYARSVVTSGQDQTPFWGKLELNGAGRQCLGCERESSRQESLYLYFKPAQGTQQEQRCEVPASLWDRAKLQSEWTMEKGKLSGNLHCDSLKPVN